MMESDLISVNDAIAILDAAPVAPRVKRVPLEQAMGFRLARDIESDRDYPPFDKSLMDGFAVRVGDVTRTPTTLQIIGEVAAGKQFVGTLRSGQAVAIMTGAPLPDGADAVVPVEDCEKQNTQVVIKAAPTAGRNIARRGSDCATNSPLLRKGVKLEAAQLAVAASVGMAEVEVFDRPHVVVLSTGDELVEVGQSPGPSQIRNSNNVMLAALLRRLGCSVADMGFVRDDPAVIRQAIERGLESDALFVSGGMSMGEYDYVPRILKELGAELKITKLRIKPGKPFVFAEVGGSYVFGLPGNPVSSFVCTLRLASRLLARMGGMGTLEKWRSAPLASPLEANGPREFYQPVLLDDRHVMPLKWKGSADIYTLSQANALLVRPENAPALPAGEVVRVLEIPS